MEVGRTIACHTFRCRPRTRVRLRRRAHRLRRGPIRRNLSKAHGVWVPGLAGARPGRPKKLFAGALDINPSRIIVQMSDPFEGALMRRHGKRDRMRRPRAGFANLFSGGPGQPSGPTTRVCLEWLDEAGSEGWRKPPARGREERPASPTRKYGARDRKAAMARRKAPRVARMRRVSLRTVRQTARHPPRF